MWSLRQKNRDGDSSDYGIARRPHLRSDETGCEPLWLASAVVLTQL